MKYDYNLKIYEAGEKDSIKIWEWRNDVHTRNMSRKNHFISWEEHCNWFNKIIDSSIHKLYIFKHQEKSIGIVSFSKEINRVYEISININPKYRNRKYGKYILIIAIDKLLKETKSDLKLLASIKRNNHNSQKLFEGLLFKLQSSDIEYMRYSLNTNISTHTKIHGKVILEEKK